MITAIVIGVLVLGAASLILARRMGALRQVSLVSPILLDEALDPDLRGLCQQLRRRDDLSPSDRSRFCHLIVSVAERRVLGESTEADRRRVRRATRALKRGTITFETELGLDVDRDIQTGRQPDVGSDIRTNLQTDERNSA